MLADSKQHIDYLMQLRSQLVTVANHETMQIIDNVIANVKNDNTVNRAKKARFVLVSELAFDWRLAFKNQHSLALALEEVRPIVNMMNDDCVVFEIERRGWHWHNINGWYTWKKDVL